MTIADELNKAVQAWLTGVEDITNRLIPDPSRESPVDVTTPFTLGVGGVARGAGRKAISPENLKKMNHLHSIRTKTYLRFSNY